MKERLQTIPIQLHYPGASAALGANCEYFMFPFDMTIVAVSASPSDDEASGTIDINDDGTGVITAVDCSDKDVPGEWQATGYGGSNDPVYVAAGSEMSIDANSFSNGIQALVVIYAIVGESVG